MNKYLDMHSSDAIDLHYLTTTVAAEAKKENSWSMHCNNHYTTVNKTCSFSFLSYF